MSRDTHHAPRRATPAAWWRVLRAALLAVLSFGVGATPGRAADGEPVRPSVLLITLDTTRADRLGCYGADGAPTPNLDALAAAGVRFERALAPSPLTLPSHATLLTGLVPRRHGVRNNSLFPLSAEPVLLTGTLRRAGYATAAFVSSAVLDRRMGLDRDFERYDDTVRVGDRRAFNHEERAASQTTDAALGHLGALRPPFFLWVHYFDPHLPYVPPEPYRSRFAGRPYDGEIAFVDAQVGRLLAAVRERAGPLLVAVAGDHGESLGDHGERAHGVFLYQSTQRVPLILSGHGVPRGRVVGRNVGLVDVAPTVLGLLGLPPLRGVDGESLLPLPGPGENVGDEPGYELETFYPRFAYGWSPLRALVRERWKYVEAPEAELYDLRADPAERKNLLGERRAVAQRLARELAALTAGDDPDPGAIPEDPALAEHRRRLESLGYVGGATRTPSGETLPDPKRMIGLVGELDAARAELGRGETREAAARLERLLAKSPRNVPAMLVLAGCRSATGDHDAAVATVRRALELAPEDDLVWFNLANVLSARAGAGAEALSEAREAFEETLRRNPRHADAYLNYAALLIRHDTPAAARALLVRAVEAGVRDPGIELELGLLELSRGETGAAVAAFRRAVELHDCLAEAHEALGHIAFGQERAAESVRHYERALACEPSARLAKTLGSIYLDRLGDTGRAVGAWRRALELAAPDDPDRATLRELIDELGGGR